MRIRATIAIPAFLLASLLLAGCYTVLVHPSVRSDEEYARGSIYWNDNCLKCHSPEEVEYFYAEIDRDGHRTLGRLDTPWIYGPYSAFNYPWWFDSEWVLTRHGQDYEQSEKERGEGRAGRAIRQGADQLRSGSTRGAVTVPAGSGGGASRDSRQGSVTSGGSGTDKSSSGSETQTRSRDTSTGGQNQGDKGRDAGTSGNSATPARSGSTRGK